MVADAFDRGVGLVFFLLGCGGAFAFVAVGECQAEGQDDEEYGESER